MKNLDKAAYIFLCWGTMGAAYLLRVFISTAIKKSK